MGWPDYLTERAARPPPPGCGVVGGSTPVVSFGNPVGAAVATLGINPSSHEFVGGDGRLLHGDSRRLATLASLGVGSYHELTRETGALVVDECARYFERRPYHWFRPLDGILRAGAGVSYWDGTACHLDLVQWATSPLWGGLGEAERTRLLGEDTPFLVRQLTEQRFRLVLVNGREAIHRVGRVGLARWTQMAELPGPPRAGLYVSALDVTILLGWSCNLQSQPGAARHTDDLAAFVATHAQGALASERAEDAISGGDRRPPATFAPATSPAETDEARTRIMNEAVLPKGTRIGSVSELVERLEAWLLETDADRLGMVGGYGGTEWLRVETSLGPFALNSDTRRDAIEDFVRTARRGGGLRMDVVANRRGQINKVVFEGCKQGGWYAYLKQPLAQPESTAFADSGATGTALDGSELPLPGATACGDAAHTGASDRNDRETS